MTGWVRFHVTNESLQLSPAPFSFEITRGFRFTHNRSRSIEYEYIRAVPIDDRWGDAPAMFSINPTDGSGSIAQCICNRPHKPGDEILMLFALGHQRSF